MDWSGRILLAVITASQDLRGMADGERWFVQPEEEVSEMKILKRTLFEERNPKLT